MQPGLGSHRACPGLFLDGNSVSPAYSGLAPMLVAVDQVNFQIPQSAPQGCAVPFSIEEEGVIGPTATISIHSGRGQCVDPPIQSYGQIVMTKTTSSGTGSDGISETFTASFPSGPGVNLPPHEPLGSFVNVFALTPVFRSCSVRGYSQLSAGSIEVKAVATGETIPAQPTPASSGVVYQQSLPTGFIALGQYVLSASSNPVAFEGLLSVGSPIQIETTLTPGTKISSSQPFVVKWTGGDPGTLVRISLSTGGVYNRYDYAYVDAALGSFTLSPICMGNPVISGGNGVFCSFGIPSSNAAQVVVEVSPSPSGATYVAADGITGPFNFLGSTAMYSVAFCFNRGTEIWNR